MAPNVLTYLDDRGGDTNEQRHRTQQPSPWVHYSLLRLRHVEVRAISSSSVLCKPFNGNLPFVLLQEPSLGRIRRHEYNEENTGQHSKSTTNDEHHAPVLELHVGKTNAIHHQATGDLRDSEHRYPDALPHVSSKVSTTRVSDRLTQRGWDSLFACTMCS